MLRVSCSLTAWPFLIPINHSASLSIRKFGEQHLVLNGLKDTVNYFRWWLGLSILCQRVGGYPSSYHIP